MTVTFVLSFHMCSSYLNHVFFVFFFKQKTAYEMRISDWSSDVCSSDLVSMPPPTIVILDFGGQYTQLIARRVREHHVHSVIVPPDVTLEAQIGRASCRESVCQYV